MTPKSHNQPAVTAISSDAEPKFSWSGITILVGLLLAAIAGWLFFGSSSAPASQPEAATTADDKQEPMVFEFYEVLPNQKFQSIPEGVSIQQHKASSLPTPTTDLVIGSIAKPSDDTAAKSDDTPVSTTPDQESDRGIAQNKPSQGDYILQIKSYRKAEEADIKRAEVLMAGVDAVVIRRTTKDGLGIYQVISTPMNEAEASAASVRLRNNGIDSLIIKQ